MSVMTGALVIPIFSVKRDQPEEKRMRGSHRAGRRGVECGQSQRNDIAAHVTQAPIEGVSFAHLQPGRRTDPAPTRYYEMFGHRSICHDGWRAVCPWAGSSFTEAAQKGRYYGSPIDAKVLADLEAHDWVERPTIAKPRDSFVYYPRGSPVPFSAAPKVYNRAFSITADV
jgi:hypothetical protein